MKRLTFKLLCASLALAACIAGVNAQRIGQLVAANSVDIVEGSRAGRGIVLTDTGGTKAHWEEVNEYDYTGSTNIYFNATVNGQVATYGQVEVAAFVNGKLRGTTMSSSRTGLLNNKPVKYGLLKVWGDDADNGKDIQLKAFVNGIVYDLPNQIQYSGETVGSLSSLRQFEVFDLKAASVGFQFNDLYVNLEDTASHTIDLLDRVVAVDSENWLMYSLRELPASVSAESDLQLSWNQPNHGLYTITDNMLNPLQGTGPQGTDVSGSVLGHSLQAKIYIMPYNYFLGNETLTARDIHLNLTDTTSVDMKDYLYITLRDAASGASYGQGTWRELEQEGILPADFTMASATVASGAAVKSGTRIQAVKKTVKEGEAINFTFTYSGQTTNVTGRVWVGPWTVEPVVVPVTGLEIAFAQTNVQRGQKVSGTVTYSPADATFEAEKLKFESSLTGVPSWQVSTVSVGQKQGNVVNFTVSSTVAGNLEVRALYDQTSTSQSLTVGADVTSHNGWNWMTYYPVQGSLALTTLDNDYYHGGILDIRSQEEDNFKDEVAGFFGTLQSVDNATCYKVKDNLTNSVASTRTMWFYNQVESMDHVDNVSLKKGWNWLAYPYQNDRSWTEVRGFLPAHEGDRIISLADGFMEYSAAIGWMGTLTTLRHGQGYLYYSNEADYVMWSAESTMTAPSTTSQNKAQEMKSQWQFDAHAYRDNMSIVAKVEGLQAEDGMTIGVFCGDECRGEGRLVSAEGHQYFFITAHGKAGEQFTFRLGQDGQEYDLNGTLRFATMAGTMNQPVSFYAPGELTGISANTVARHQDVQRYDLQGRRVRETERGILLEQGRKVIR